MIPVVRVKEGVKITKLSPAGACIIGALDLTAKALGYDIWITSAEDGVHSGPDDPHHSAEAFDVRTHGVPNKIALLLEIKAHLDGRYFYTFLEDPDPDAIPENFQSNEHIHCQRKRATVYPPV